MKRMGFSSTYAGAIEACASSGGNIMPPVMGATAFIMAGFLGVDYSVIIVVALVPSILYYFGLVMQVDAYAARSGLKGLPREELPTLKSTLKRGWPFAAILIFLVWGLVYMKWSIYTPYYASALMIPLSFSSRETPGSRRGHPRRQSRRRRTYYARSCQGLLRPGAGDPVDHG